MSMVCSRATRAAVAVPIVLALALLLGFDGAAALAAAAEWPQFRGPNRDGISAETSLALAWPSSGPPEVWRVAGGEGYSGIAIAGGRGFTLAAIGDDELAIAFDPESGRELWRHRLDARYRDSQGNGPRSTPTVHGETVFALGAQGRLAALDAATGKPRWSIDLKSEVGAQPPNWGVSTSPLVEGGLLLLDAGGRPDASVVALDTTTGEVVWTSQSDKAGYSAPLAISVGGERQVLFFTGTQLVSVAPRDGALLWRLPWQTSYDVNAATPLFIAPDKLFVASGYDVGGALLRLGGASGTERVTEVWRTRGMKNQFSSSVHDGGTIYGFDNRTLKAIDAATGEDLWMERGLGHGSLILADGHLLILSETGELVVAEATPEAFRAKGRAQVLEGKCWTAPSLADGRLYLRNERELLALDLRQP